MESARRKPLRRIALTAYEDGKREAMRGIVVTVSDSYEEPPSDIILKIDFKEGDGSASRPFQIAADLIKALEELDSTLVKSVDSSIQTTLIVEDVQKSSIKVFLRNALKVLDDDSLKTLDWKPLVGQYLVKAKYAAIKWLDEDKPALSDLTEEVAKLADDAEIHHLHAPVPPNPTRLVQALDRLQSVKRGFHEGEGLTITLGPEEYSVDIGKTWVPSEQVEIPAGEMEMVAEQQTILMVRKPDMLGNTAWQFRIGKKNLTLPIEDAGWLDSYHAREIPILSGDALLVTLRTVNKFADNGELVETKQSITKVIKVIQQGGSAQGDLLD